MKAILVVDMPDECPECPLCENRNVYCLPAKKDVDDFENGIPSWCPLRPMPLKRETHVYWKSVGIGNIPTHEISDYDKGWNDCVEFLEGEEND